MADQAVGEFRFDDLVSGADRATDPGGVHRAPRRCQAYLRSLSVLLLSAQIHTGITTIKPWGYEVEVPVHQARATQQLNRFMFDQLVRGPTEYTIF